jgi:hypothetical protein
MRYFELLTEAKLTFSKADFDQAVAKSEFDVISLTMTGNGELHIGDKWHARGNTDDPEYHPDASGRRSIKITVLPKNKKIEIRKGSAGNTLQPKVQQALRALRDAGIIDNTWTIKTAKEASGYFPKLDADGYISKPWSSIPNEVDAQGLNALVDKAIRLSPESKNLVFYHGTSSIDWEKIQKVGLHPLGYGSNTQHGSESRGKHEGNAKVLYLAGSMDKALSYAKTRVDDWNIKKNKSAYIQIQDNEPVVLAVHVPDPVKLVADDDAVNDIARKISYRIWKEKSPEEQKHIMAELSAKHGFNVKDPTTGQMLWRETDAGFAAIMAKLPKSVYAAWRASLSRNDQVGYRGIIPPKFLKRII